MKRELNVNVSEEISTHRTACSGVHISVDSEGEKDWSAVGPSSGKPWYNYFQKAGFTTSENNTGTGLSPPKLDFWLLENWKDRLKNVQNHNCCPGKALLVQVPWKGQASLGGVVVKMKKEASRWSKQSYTNKRGLMNWRHTYLHLWFYPQRNYTPYTKKEGCFWLMKPSRPSKSFNLSP